jgi:hypothetical protein
MIQTSIGFEKTSQQKTVLAMLRKGKVSSSQFYAAYIPRFAARILELKKQGYDIRKTYFRDRMFNYYLVEEKGVGDVE